MPGITADEFADVMTSNGDAALITFVVVIEGVSVVSNLIFLTVLLLVNDPFDDDLIRLDSFARCWESRSLSVAIIWCLFVRCNFKYSLFWNFLPHKWQVLICDFDEFAVVDVSWFANTLATSDAAVNNDGGNCGLVSDNVDEEDSFELSVWRRLFDDRSDCSELVWDWTRGENIGFNNMPRLCWTEAAKKIKFCFLF